MNRHEKIYSRILKLIPNILEVLKEDPYANGKSKQDSESGLMPLIFEGRGTRKGKPVISLAHYYEQNGDLMSDPFMEIILHPEMKAAEAQSFEMSNPPIFQEVYFSQDGKDYVRPKYKKDCNSFLDMWTSNLIKQGHKVILKKETV